MPRARRAISLATRWRFTYPSSVSYAAEAPLKDTRSILSAWTVTNYPRGSRAQEDSFRNALETVVLGRAIENSGD